jgi:hypothetical protein
MTMRTTTAPPSPSSPASSPSHEDSRRAIDAHFAGRAVPRLEAAMRAHTLDCASCRSYYDRHLLLARLDPTALGAEARIARGLGLAARPRAGGRRAGWLAALALPVAAAAILLAWPHRDAEHRGPSPSPFAARSGGRLGPKDREPALWIYRLDAGGPARVVDGRVQPADELAFAYANPAGKPYLLVFGVDEHRHVYWFHPAWAPGQSPPRAVQAAPGPGPHELGEAIRHRVDGRRLIVRAVLADRPLGVADVEAGIRDAPSWDALPAFSPSDAIQVAGQSLQVSP